MLFFNRDLFSFNLAKKQGGTKIEKNLFSSWKSEEWDIVLYILFCEMHLRMLVVMN